MLEQVLDYIHNYFVKEVYRGKFKVESGSMTLDFLQTDQYFKIVGSVFNDGVYKYPVSDLHDEEFTGEVWALSIPPAVIGIVGEIEDWIDKYGDVANSPYASESFGGYTYTKTQGYNSSANNKSMMSWQATFGSRLNQWRKIS